MGVTAIELLSTYMALALVFSLMGNIMTSIKVFSVYSIWTDEGWFKVAWLFLGTITPVFYLIGFVFCMIGLERLPWRSVGRMIATICIPLLACFRWIGRGFFFTLRAFRRLIDFCTLEKGDTDYERSQMTIAETYKPATESTLRANEVRSIGLVAIEGAYSL
jgi:hypothetical protein